MSIPGAPPGLSQVCSDSWGTGGVEGKCVEITHRWMGIEIFRWNFEKTFLPFNKFSAALPLLRHSLGLTLEQQVSAFKSSSLQFYP